MRIPPEKVDEIYRAMDIMEIVSDYVTLKKKGTNYWALSPFAKEKSPSFAVNPTKGIYKCFSTGKGGNAIGFLMELEGYSYPEALQHVAKKYSIEIPEEQDNHEYVQQRDHLESLHIVMQYAADFYHKNLMESEIGRMIGLAYFKERGILETTIKTFQLGYAFDEWESLAKQATADHHNADYLVEVGLCSRSEKTQKLIDRFRDRVMFPITNPVGKVVGFGGRILKNKENEAKYINSPESPIYHKSNILFGLHQARTAIREKNLCILTEGYLDVIALYQAGILNVVASSGTSLTEEQSKLIRRFTKNVLFVYDGDAAGVKATMRGIDILVAEGMAVRCLTLPDNHDPDSFVKAFGAAAFEQQISKNSLDFMDYKIQELQKTGGNSPSEQTERLRTLAQTLARIPDAIEQQMYVRDVAIKLKVAEDLMQQAVAEAMKTQQKETVREIRRVQGSVPAPVVELKPQETLPFASQEKEIMRILIRYHNKSFLFAVDEDPNAEPVEINVAESIMMELAGISMYNAVYEEIKKYTFEVYEQKKNWNLDIHFLLNHENEQIRSTTADLYFERYSISENWKKYDVLTPELDQKLSEAVFGPILYYKFQQLGKLISEQKQVLKQLSENPETDATKEDEEFARFNELLLLKQKIDSRIGIEGASWAF